MKGGDGTKAIGDFTVKQQLRLADKHGVLNVASRGIGRDEQSGECFVCGQYGVYRNFVTVHMPTAISERLHGWYPSTEITHYQGDPFKPRINFRGCDKHAEVLKAVSDHTIQNRMEIVTGNGKTRRIDYDTTHCCLYREAVDNLIEAMTEGENIERVYLIGRKL